MYRWISIPFLLLLLLATGAAIGAEVYRWVDEDGKVHFGDRPPEEAERLDIGSPSVADPVAVPERSLSAGEEQPAGEEAVDYSIRIDAPADETTVRDNEGRVRMSLDVRPEFDSEHRIVVLVNGSPVEGGPFEEADIEVQGLHRGTHELQALLRDAEGRTLARSGTVTIYLHQASALSPNR